MQGFLLSLGILLGIVTPQPDPTLAVRLFRSGGQLCATVEVRNAVNPQVLKLIQAGNRMGLVLTVSGPIEDGARAFTHRISFDPVGRVYAVEIEEAAARHQTTSQEAAVDIYSRFFAIPLATASDIRFPARIEMRAELAALELMSFDPLVLWNYHVPVFRVRFNGLTDYEPSAESMR